jgi:hypothetical protein
MTLVVSKYHFYIRSLLEIQIPTYVYKKHKIFSYEVLQVYDTFLVQLVTNAGRFWTLSMKASFDKNT